MTLTSLVPFITVIVCGCFAGSSSAQEYIGGEKIAAIGAGSMGVAYAGWLALSVDSSKTPLIRGPLPLERKLQHLIGGSYHPERSNFLNNSLGSAVTPFATGMIVLAADLCYPQGEKSKTVMQDLFLYSTGLLATGGVTDLAKGLIARERPIPSLYPELAAHTRTNNHPYDRHSFFSGHTSSAFFGITFANKRLRCIMRDKMTNLQYRSWRWLPPALLYGWGSFVGWSRIHAYEHFVSDVLVGAMVGYLMAELFYHFGDDAYANFDGNGTPLAISINIKF